jgi:hypothetical protein
MSLNDPNIFFDAWINVAKTIQILRFKKIIWKDGWID